MYSANQVVIGGDLVVNRIGLGTNRIHRDDHSIHALKTAIKVGINFIDTASAYTNGESEETIGQTLAPYKEIFVATKGGMVAPDFHIDSSVAMLKHSLEKSLERLKLDTIPLYFLHRVDPEVPLKESVSFLKQMQDEGKIKHIGLSEVTVAQIEEARNIVNIAAVENEYNLSNRKHDEVITYAEKEGIVFIPFFPMHFTIKDTEKFLTIQEKYHATSEQLAITWLLKRSPIILPIPGSLSPKHLEENAAALNIKLGDEDFQKLTSYVHSL
jgi:pyridoxine 4-dehydrogenase